VKIAVISDIHGNLAALLQVLETIHTLRVDEIYCLGDIAGYYAEVNECCEVLRDRDVKCILGNHDWYLASGVPCPRSKSANDRLKYQHSVITPGNKRWLASLPLFRTCDQISMVHGGWTNPIDEYLVPTDEQLRAVPTAVGCSGHTHKQAKVQRPEKTYCNPGSVGQPRDSDWRAAFAIFDAGVFELHRTEYDVERTCCAMHRAGFSEYYYRRLRTGSANFVE
jgi:putative phosphoesterase